MNPIIEIGTLNKKKKKKEQKKSSSNNMNHKTVQESNGTILHIQVGDSYTHSWVLRTLNHPKP